MKFLNGNEWLTHPQASRISNGLGIHLFRYELTDTQLALMSSSLDMISELDALDSKDDTSQLKALICIIASHADASAADLIKKAEQFNIAPAIIFQSALIVNHMDIINSMDTNSDELKSALLSQPILGLIIRESHLDGLKQFFDIYPQHKEEWLLSSKKHANDVFYYANMYGRVDILDWLKKENPDALTKRIEADNYSFIGFTSSSNQTSVLDWLKQEVSDDVFTEMIKANNCGALRQAFLHRSTQTLDWFKQKIANDVFAELIKNNGHDFMSAAVSSRHAETLDWLKKEIPDSVLDELIKADNYKIFCHAAVARRDNTKVLNWLKQKAPDALVTMIAANNYMVFYLAAQYGHTEVLNWLKQNVPDALPKMITSNDYWAFKEAFKRNHPAVINVLFKESPPCFAYAEVRDGEYGDIVVYPFITQKLKELRQQDHLSQPEAELYFFILRNLIRRNSLEVLDDINYLLQVPAIRALAHQTVGAGRPNELLLLALDIGNERAARALLTITAVHTLTVANHFYRAKPADDMNLRAIANNAESSMLALTQGEINRLDDVLAGYQPKIDEVGIDLLLDQLRHQLMDDYEKNPATIKTEDKIISLPVTYEDFCQQNLTPDEHKDAMEAYYQHKIHTALRYISRPNHWIDGEAAFVNWDNDDRSLRWSNFEKNQVLIVKLWLATIDETMIPCDGHTLASRFEHFIDELALIGRAHNWDDARPVINAKGESVTEAYDDLKGDKPSCLPGTKKRLYQSVIGHPLLKTILTEDVLDSELRDFLRTEFSQRINNDNRLSLQKYSDDYINELQSSEEGITAFKALNITAEQHETFITHLKEKYGKPFDVFMCAYIDRKLALDANSSDPFHCLHFFKYAGLVDYQSLLTPPLLEGLARNGLFGSSSSSSQEPLNPDNYRSNLS